MVFCDPPKHTRCAALLEQGFTPHAVEAMRAARACSSSGRIIDRACRAAAWE